VSHILYFWVITWTVIILIFVGAFLIDAFNDLCAQLKEFFHE